MSNWLSRVFDHPDLAGALIIAAKTLLVYAFLVLGVRLVGKRQLGQMSLYDLVLIVVLGNSVQNAMMNNDNSLVGGLISATTLLVVNRAFGAFYRRSRRLEQAMVGHPVVIVQHGSMVDGTMRREGITRDHLRQALREHGLCRPEEARLCVLEVDGSISVVPNGAEVHTTKRHFEALRVP